jgi:hypothetical protein
MVAGIWVVPKVSFPFKGLLTSKQGAHRRGRREDGLKGEHEKHPLEGQRDEKHHHKESLRDEKHPPPEREKRQSQASLRPCPGL